MRAFALGCYVIAGLGVAFAQADPASKMPDPAPLLVQELQIGSSTQTQFSGSIFWRVKCDPQGNLYLRKHTDQMAIENRVLHSPVQKVSPDGSVLAVFNLENAVPKLWGATDFFVTGDGTLFQIAATSDQKPTYYILKFQGDGSLDAKIQLNVETFSPYQLAVFKSGEFLVSGVVGGKEPFIAIFDSAGKLVRRLDNPDGSQPGLQLETPQPGSTPEPDINLQVAMSEAVTASDGNVYFMKASSPLSIYGITPAGNIIKRFQVSPEDPKLVPVVLRPAEGKLLIVFTKKGGPDIFLRVVDFDGNNLAAFHLQDKRARATSFACYAPPTFTFFEASSRGPAIIHKIEAK